MKDYSQSGEQKLILEYFGDFVGTALDVGANDGVLLSNSRALIERFWTAVLVEPAPIAFKKLMKNCGIPEELLGADTMIVGGGINGEIFWQLVNAAITPQDGPVDFYDSGTHLHQGDTSLLSTTRPEEMARWKKSGETFTKTTVRGITMETLMAETGARHFDFISIDVEGADYDVLKQCDLTAMGCRMLIVEAVGRSADPFIAYCSGHGLKLRHRNYENLIFAK